MYQCSSYFQHDKHYQSNLWIIAGLSVLCCECVCSSYTCVGFFVCFDLVWFSFLFISFWFLFSFHCCFLLLPFFPFFPSFLPSLVESVLHSFLISGFSVSLKLLQEFGISRLSWRSFLYPDCCVVYVKIYLLEITHGPLWSMLLI